MEQTLTMPVQEAAKVLGISRSAAYDAVHRGQIPVIKIGDRMLVPRAALLRMIDAASAPKVASTAE